jgi:hypothetical protein
MFLSPGSDATRIADEQLAIHTEAFKAWEALSNAMFGSPASPATRIAKDQLTKQAKAFRAWEALFDPPPRDEGSTGDAGSNEGGS